MTLEIFVINPKNDTTSEYKQFLTLNVRLFSWELQINFRVQFNAKQSSNTKQVTLFRIIYSQNNNKWPLQGNGMAAISKSGDCQTLFCSCKVARVNLCTKTWMFTNFMILPTVWAFDVANGDWYVRWQMLKIKSTFIVSVG